MMFFRVLTLVIGLYTIYIFTFRLAAGMVPVWLVLFGISLFFSTNTGYGILISYNWVKAIVAVGLVVLIGTEVLIIRAGISSSLETEGDYIIILGAKVNGENMSRSLRLRAELGLEYLEANPDAKAVLSGGQGPDEGISEAEAVKRFFISAGIDEGRLIIENQSTSTKENLTFSKALIEEDIAENNNLTGSKNSTDATDNEVSTGVKELTGIKEADILVVSNQFHIYRATLLAREVGLEVKGLGADSFILLVPNYYLREFFGVWAVWFGL